MADITKLQAQVEAQRKKCDQEKQKLAALESKLAQEETKEIFQLMKKFNITDMGDLEKALSDWQTLNNEKENEDE